MNQDAGRTDSIHFVTGKLAEPALRAVVESLSQRHGFDYTIAKLPITVAALMTTRWLLRHLEIPEGTTRLVLPGYLQSGTDTIREHAHAHGFPQLKVECGPKDLRDLPIFFGETSSRKSGNGEYSIEIIAEINHANRLPLADLQQKAQRLQQAGADVIDLGCEPGQFWSTVPDAVKSLRDLGLRLSIDSFDPAEVALATKAGAELVLSVDRNNCHAAGDWGREVVVIPDDTHQLATCFEQTIQSLEKQGVPYRLDPILEPIGCGFARSLQRYYWTREHYPEARMMMGIGNLTELTDGDSAAINTLLLGYCQELNIHSVLTTEVINWARSSVQECDLARRLVHAAVQEGIPPKHLEPKLILLRDPRLRHHPPAFLEHLAQTITDHNYRILLSEGEIHLLAAGVHLHGTDPFEIVGRLLRHPDARPLDASHAFYLGYEMAKAATALTLDKNYEQDQALQWGYLTRDEQSHRLP